MFEPELTIDHYPDSETRTWVATDTRLGRTGAGPTRRMALERLKRAYGAWVEVQAREAL